ncbi:hypothetical protein [Actinoplanes sp. NPDC051494]|uniref:hypothetical protein n=1 Tax=Actinoplanes sp. NPDC051494 TaxID=3363907 RepID=UPI00378F47B3
MTLSGSPARRAALRHDLVASIETDRHTGRPSTNSGNRQRYLNLARLDLTEHLGGTPPHRPRSYDFGRVTILGEQIVQQPWPEISAEIDRLAKDPATARTIKLQLADHTWCAWLVGLIQLIELFRQGCDVLSDAVRTMFAENVLRHFPPGLWRMVADLVVDRFWAALTTLLRSHVLPVGADLLRALRILTVFICPSIEDHREVYDTAMRPLMGESFELISDGVKAQLTALFTAWWGEDQPYPG